MTILQGYDKQIYDTIRAEYPYNQMLPYLIIAQARLESGNYKSNASKGNNFFGLKLNNISKSFGAYEGIAASDGGSYCAFPTVRQGILAQVYLYRQGGLYSGILNATTSKEFCDYLANGGYTYGQYMRDYYTSIPSIMQKVILEHPEILEPFIEDGQKKNQLFGGARWGSFSWVIAVRSKLLHF